mmetsp:Transcript_1630/g.2156  ORF Transcript_1630/g.2156 Transcript_1630/m.2156 type:complete len:225 (+) Transcript_1630:151-825(+)
MNSIALLIAFLPSLISAKVVSLNDSNYYDVTSGKLLFVKFFAPWCGHCKSMAADWEELGTTLAEEKYDILIAEVDCTSDDAESICQDNGIEGFPTLKYGDPSFLEDYEGSREFDEMYSFATTSVKHTCSPNNIELCDDETKAKIEKIKSIPIEELQNDVAAIEEALDEADEDFDDLTDGLDDEYMGIVESVNKAKSEAKAAANYDIMKDVESMRRMKSGSNDEL